MTPADEPLFREIDAPAGRVDGTVVLLNGGFMTTASWEPLARRLAECCRVVRCDFRGQLRSPGQVREELAGNVGDLVALLDGLDSAIDGGIEPVHLLGTSFGGEIALLLAARHPERVASLVAVTVSDYATDEMRSDAREMRRLIARLLPGEDRGKFHDRLVEEVYSTDYVAANGEVLAARREQIASLPDAWFASAMDLLRAIESFDLRPELPAIRCPALVVVAREDRVTPPDRGRAVARAIAGAELIEHPTSGHALVAEHPDWLADRALRFFASVDGDRDGGGGV